MYGTTTKSSEVAEQILELKANPLQSHAVLHSIRHNIARQPPWSYHSRRTMTAETIKHKLLKHKLGLENCTQILQ